MPALPCMPREQMWGVFLDVLLASLGFVFLV